MYHVGRVLGTEYINLSNKIVIIAPSNDETIMRVMIGDVDKMLTFASHYTR